MAPSTREFAGIRAAEEILERVYRVSLSKALDPLNQHDFLVIHKRLADAIKDQVGVAQGAAMRKALNELDVDWPTVTDAKREQILLAARNALYLPPQVVQHSIEILGKTGKDVVGATKENTADQFKLNLASSWTKQDERIVKHLAGSQAHYFRNSEGKRLDLFAQDARDIVAKGVDQGLGRKELGQDLKAALNQHANRTDAYWTMVAGVYINRARTFAQLSSYQESGIEKFTFESILDEVTTLQCRFMHGRVFSVTVALERYDQVAAADDPEDVRYLQPWLNVGKNKETGEQYLYTKDKDGGRTVAATVKENAIGQSDKTGRFAPKLSDMELQAKGCVTPPLHGNCRSTLVPDMSSAFISAPAAPPRAPRPVEGAPLGIGAPAPGLAPAGPQLPAPLPREFDVGAPLGAAGQLGGLKPASLVSPFGGLPLTEEEEAAAAAKPAGEQLPVWPKPPLPFSEQVLQGMGVGDYPGLTTGKGAKMKLVVPFSRSTDNSGKAIMPFGKPPSSGYLWQAKKKEPVSIASKDVVALADAIKVSDLTDELKHQASKYPVAVKYGGKYYVVQNLEGTVAQHVAGGMDHNGEKYVKMHVIDWEKKAPKTPAVPVAAPPPPKPIADAIYFKPVPPNLPPPVGAPSPGAPPPAPKKPAGAAFPAKLADVTSEKVGEQKGSNPGGTYRGTDGVDRYVKLYTDPSQASGEHLANKLYADLGHHALNSNVYVDPKTGQPTAYASELIQGVQTLKASGLTEAKAKKAMDGFAADVLVGNWDAVGMDLDNMVVDKHGNVIRIDNGGSFLMRAKAGRKPESSLNKIEEVEVFLSSKNPSYQKVANAAGYHDVEDLKDLLSKQVPQISALRDAHGGWGNYVANNAPHLNAVDRKAVVTMLDERTKKLEALVKDYSLPPDQRPAKFENLPKRSLSDFIEKQNTMKNVSRAEESKNIASTSGPGYSAMKDFTAGGYRRMRAPGQEDKPLAADTLAFDKWLQDSKPLRPGTTVFRGIHCDNAHRDEHLKQDVMRVCAPVSFSRSEDTAKQFGGSVVYVLKHQTGVGVTPVSSHSGEHEVVMRTDRYIKIVDRFRDSSRPSTLVVVCEEVGGEEHKPKDKAKKEVLKV